MSFFKSLKGDFPDKLGGSALGKKPRNEPLEKKYPLNTGTTYNPPPGPPPSHQALYSPPPGPPPGQAMYAPPRGPPPSHKETIEDPPPYHDWTSIPDTALLPPPPTLGHAISPSGNANLSDADRAHEWCRFNPLKRPHQPRTDQIESVRTGDVRLLKPQEYNGDLLMPSKGIWKGSTRAGSKDSCLITSMPLYFASAESPLQTEVTKTIYFELKIRSLGRGRGTDESSLALGFCAMPYPTWRMPGWERGSLAVHGDDGRKYVNDTWGGKDFTSAFQVGDTVGIGMSLSVSNSPPEYGAPPQTGAVTNVEVFFTRNGTKDGGWNLHEELDRDNDLGVDGLDGQFDLYGAVGVFGGAEFDVSFHRRDWLWLPR